MSDEITPNPLLSGDAETTTLGEVRKGIQQRAEERHNHYSGPPDPKRATIYGATQQVTDRFDETFASTMQRQGITDPESAAAMAEYDPNIREQLAIASACRNAVLDHTAEKNRRACDDEFARVVPSACPADREEAISFLKASGMTDEQIADAWNWGSLREPRNQVAVLRAARQRAKDHKELNRIAAKAAEGKLSVRDAAKRWAILRKPVPGKA
jgi:hypothetical protein